MTGGQEQVQDLGLFNTKVVKEVDKEVQFINEKVDERGECHESATAYTVSGCLSGKQMHPIKPLQSPCPI